MIGYSATFSCLEIDSIIGYIVSSSVLFMISHIKYRVTYVLHKLPHFSISNNNKPYCALPKIDELCSILFPTSKHCFGASFPLENVFH